MAPEKREPHPSLADRLFKEFFRFSFFRAVGLLESLSPGKKALGNTLVPGEEAVRFSVKPGRSFPPSDIANLKDGGEKGPARMEVAFLGMIGPSGVLPYWYDELAAERIRQKDLSFPAFLDLFHHRLISLFYLAWKKYRFAENYSPGGKDRFSSYLLSLIGLGTPGLLGGIGLPPESLIFYSGLISGPVPSASGIERAVEYFSGTSAEVEQFIDQMISISPEDQTRLGLANGRLGVDAFCGSWAWENQTKFRVRLGPMGYVHFLRLLPSGDLLRPIFSLVRYMAGIEYEFEVRLILRREEVPPCVLGVESPGSPRLGWTTWLKTPGYEFRKDPSITFGGPECLC